MPLDAGISVIFLLFCRIGGCLMTTPGFSSERVPMRVRLGMAIAVTLALTPPLAANVKPDTGADAINFALVVVAELAIGLFLGLLARLYLLALEMLANATSVTIGLGNIFGPAVHEIEPTPTLAAFISFGAVTLIFVTDQHLEIIRGLYLSYQAAPVSHAIGADAMLDEMTRVLSQSHLLALRISSPFLIFGLIVNLAFGFLARLAPSVPIYFVSGPFVILLGVYAFFLAAPDFFTGFLGQFGAWLSRG